MYDSVYLIAHGLDELYRTNPGMEIVNFEGDCYQDKATYAWTLGAEIYAKFTTVCQVIRVAIFAQLCSATIVSNERVVKSYLFLRTRTLPVIVLY